MNTIGSLINTSAHDAKITLEGMLASRPAEAARTALDLLEALQGKEGQASRRKVAASVLRKAAKELEAS
ncbi:MULTISPECIES: hypothetical protein [unclassified Halomonas]|uniref:hypothetical protein n=1 Tax=unclassified Halomonas TaxID=2609666 RepID=UPI002886A8AD|nr:MULTISPECIES: hypothetical protein [unclassified Halomonas]MDT0499673.1 hypothetical protein [Halomonas sp. PAR7]MDT0510510.1 hypothetical protein [Halomonas sp. LES1]MDT0592691.1 hypothetical protein [Halomonas sp. PAR8]